MVFCPPHSDRLLSASEGRLLTKSLSSEDEEEGEEEEEEGSDERHKKREDESQAGEEEEEEGNEEKELGGVVMAAISDYTFGGVIGQFKRIFSLCNFRTLRNISIGAYEITFKWPS